MFRACILIAILLWASLPAQTSSFKSQAVTPVQRPLRVALIGLAPFGSAGNVAAARTTEMCLKDALARDARVAMAEPSQVQMAVAGIKYDGSINMSTDEARRLGSAIGCDFFIVGKAEVFTRSERKNEEHEEAFAGVMIVDSRSGVLAVFDFLNERAPDKEAALSALIRSLGPRIPIYVERMNEFRAGRESPPRQGAGSGDLERIEDLSDVESAPGAGFKAPEFLNRVKPEYTDEADRAGIAATVEASVVFRSSGEVGRIEIKRWAGFGLDDAAERAIRQLKFKPATRDGRAVSVRATVRYNFRRISDSSVKPSPLDTNPEN